MHTFALMFCLLIYLYKLLRVEIFAGNATGQSKIFRVKNTILRVQPFKNFKNIREITKVSTRENVCQQLTYHALLAPMR